MDSNKLNNIKYLLDRFECKAISAYSSAENRTEYDIMIESDKEKYSKALYILSTMPFGAVYVIDDFIDMVECDLVKDCYGYGKLVDSDCNTLDADYEVECNVEFLEDAKERGTVYVKWYTKTMLKECE